MRFWGHRSTWLVLDAQHHGITSRIVLRIRMCCDSEIENIPGKRRHLYALLYIAVEKSDRKSEMYKCISSWMMWSHSSSTFCQPSHSRTLSILCTQGPRAILCMLGEKGANAHFWCLEIMWGDCIKMCVLVLDLSCTHSRDSCIVYILWMLSTTRDRHNVYQYTSILYAPVSGSVGGKWWVACACVRMHDVWCVVAIETKTTFSPSIRFSFSRTHCARRSAYPCH